MRDGGRGGILKFGRILHLKSELEILDCAELNRRLSNLRFRFEFEMQDWSNFKIPPPGRLNSGTVPRSPRHFLWSSTMRSEDRQIE